MTAGNENAVGVMAHGAKTNNHILLADHNPAPSANQAPDWLQPTKLAIAFGSSKHNRVTASPLTWGELAELLSKPEIGEKGGTGIVPAKIATGMRCAEHVESVSLLMLDVEQKAGTPPAIADIAARLDSAGLRALIYSTFNHTPEAPRYRIVIALTRGLRPDEVRPLGLMFATHLGLSDCIDTQCLDPARLFYMPRCPQERIGLFEFRQIEGEPLDVDALLPNAPAVAPMRAEYPPAIEVDGATLADLQSALDFMSSDDRERWVRMGHALCKLGERGFRMWLDWSRKSDKFDERDAVRVWNSCKGGRTDFRAVFAEAQRQGWSNPARHDAGPFSGDLSALAWSSKEKAPAFVFVPLQGAENAPDELPHIVGQLVPVDEVTLFGGHGGGGKSYIALIIAVHVALGRSIGGFPVKQSNVIFFSAEDGAQVLQHRLRKICAAYSIGPANLEGKLHLIDAAEIDPTLYQDGRAGASPTPLLDKLVEIVETLDAGLIVVDNASDVFAGDEIKRTQVRGFIRTLRSRIARPGRAVLLLTHINKASASGAAAGREDYSGSTAWHNSVRSRLSLLPAGQDSVTVEHQKANLGRKAAPLRFDWIDGLPIVRGCIPSPEAAAAENQRREADKAAIVEIIADFERRGELVTTAVQGAYSTFRLLSPVNGFPKHLTSDSLTGLLRELQAEHRIERRTIKTPQRKMREGFFCKSAPNRRGDDDMQGGMQGEGAK